MLKKVLDFQKKKSMFLTDTSEDIDAYLRYITSKKIYVFWKWTPLVYIQYTVTYDHPSMFLTDTSEDIDAYLRYIASKEKTMFFFEVDTPSLYPIHCYI